MRRRILLAMVAIGYCLPMTASAQEQKPTDLFNGKDLAGWDCWLEDDNAKLEDVWSVKDGVLICKGTPMGYLFTKEKYKNFRLRVVWRWTPGKDPGNSGVLLRITGEKTSLLPKCVEAQLKGGSAGDIWAFNGFTITSDSPRFKQIDHEKLGKMMGVGKDGESAEKKPGEWNEYEITMRGGRLMLKVNGKKMNQCTGCDLVEGQIGLQSEGGEIQFKEVKLMPMVRNRKKVEKKD